MRLITLDDPEARHAATVGHKAARLALARSAGLPALPGRVLPLASASSVMATATRKLESSGWAAAVLAVADTTLDASLVVALEIAASTLGPRLIVRSSTQLEADARWSGAFTTYRDVAPADLPAAVRGCWASAFSRDVRARADGIGVAASEISVGVLIQPMLELEAGGSASVGSDGTVTVTGVAGSPASLFSGHGEGRAVEVTPDGRLHADPEAPGGLAGAFVAAALLARRVVAATGDDTIEWGMHRGETVLLQASRGSRSVLPLPRPPALGRIVLPASALPLAMLMQRYPAPLGEHLVLPWALDAPHLVDAPAIAAVEPRVALAEIQHLATLLASQAWQAPPRVAMRRAREWMRRVLGAETDGGLRAAGAHHGIDPAASVRLRGLVEGIGQRLATAGLLTHPALVWRLTPGELRCAVHRDSAVPVRLGPDRWEPFVFAVVSALGTTRTGVAAAPGIGAGRLAVLREPDPSTPPAPRSVLAIRAPAPQFASLLWGAAGLVTESGSPGAHLFEVARSLGVPAVIGTGLGTERGGAGTLVAVDGAVGSVAVAPAHEAERRGASAAS